MKRVAVDDYAYGADEAPKRRRVGDNDNGPEQNVTNVRQLQQLISFDQTNIGNLIAGIKTFKAFLDAILYPDSEHGEVRPAYTAILHDLLDPAKRSKVAEAAPFLPDLIQAWSYASQTNNDTLLFSVTNILALLMKTLSALLDFRDHGAALCWTMLQRDQLKLLSKGLCAESHKERIISPTLRLMTEMVSFDGGAWASRFYERQDSTFNLKFMDRNLKLSRAPATAPMDTTDRRKQSVRGNAVRYLLAFLRFLPIQHKIKVAENRVLFRTLFEHLRHDPAFLVQDILRGIETHVLEAEDVPRKLKSAIMSDRSLAAVLETARQTSASANVALAFLTRVCTVQKLGVLLPSTWFPTAVDAYGDSDDKDDGEVRNHILAKFLPSLRPHSNLAERSLALAIFNAAPELLSHQNLRIGESLSMDPKPTITFVGYAAYFQALLDLDVPPFFGNPDLKYAPRPPTILTMIENVLPLALTQKVLVKCLNQPVELITLLSLRILMSSIKRLKKVLSMLSEAVQHDDAYREPRQRLITAYLQRFPPVKDIMLASRKCPDSHLILKEAFLRLRALCLDILPNVTSDEAVDVAASLSTHMATDRHGGALQALQLQHLLSIAERTPGLQWWVKQTGSTITPFTTLLVHYTKHTTSKSMRDSLGNLLKLLISEHGILHSHDDAEQTGSLDALLSSLMPSKDFLPSQDTWTFVDDCVARLVKRPVAYLDMLDVLASQKKDPNRPISLLAVVCMEQAPFTKRLSSASMANALLWISRFFSALQNVGESETLLSAMRIQISTQGIKLPKCTVVVDAQLSVTRPIKLSETITPARPVAAEQSTSELGELFTLPAPEKDSHPELTKYKSLDTSALLDDPTLPALILALSSKYPEVRRQSHTALHAIVQTLSSTPSSTPTTEPRQAQTYILLGELLETISNTPSPADLSSKPVPYLLTTFTTHALRILVSDPTSPLYPSINRFLLKDPSWRPRRLLSWWLDATVFVPGGPGAETTTTSSSSSQQIQSSSSRTESLDPETYWARVAFVTGWMLDSLRTERDAEMLLLLNGSNGSSGVLEALMGLLATPGLPRGVQDDGIAVLWRVMSLSGHNDAVAPVPAPATALAAAVETPEKGKADRSTLGATALVTSAGILAWLEGRLLAGKIERAVLRKLLVGLEENVDRSKVAKWSSGGFESELERLKALV